MATYEIVPPEFQFKRWMVYILSDDCETASCKFFDTEQEAKNFILIERLSD